MRKRAHVSTVKINRASAVAVSMMAGDEARRRPGEVPHGDSKREFVAHGGACRSLTHVL